ncbi:outer membrane protein A [Pseudomonas saudimassiliensis]|uniref:Outer membrane protein A n=1 Tax=Pseudomonas saudimassiliensis TaxID=1461581 RepID=A0A078MPF0_9PSED|nr:outer membrane beta-barrel protein [Pseudomonas saudimassiliensis]CEA06706.1 outer membrane protein A [Pseudomonas saudimassiliensis]CEF28050.1 outer membrane protein A [Pseudomonas saudimassiliensis]
MLRKSLLAVLVSGLMVTGVQAADSQINGYLFGNVGQSETDLSDLEDMGLSTDEKATAYKVGAGVQLNRHIGVEFQYVDLGEVSADVPGLKAEIGAKGFGANLVGSLPFDRFKVYGKVGYHQMESDWRVKLGGDTFAKGDDDSNVTSFAIGATYALTPQFELVAEFERYQDVGDEDSTGEADVDLASIGLRYNF